MKKQVSTSAGRRLCRRLTALLLAALCIVTLLPAASATALVPCMSVDSSLLMIGDSNTVALRNYNADLDPATIYARISGRIEETVENWSSYHAAGYDKGIYQLLSELSGSDFDTVVVNMGTNNIGLSLTKFRSCYAQLLTNLFAKNPNAVVYVCLILPTNPAHGESSYTPAAVAKINEQVTSVQAEYAQLGFDVRILDLNTPFADANGVLLADYDSGGGVHLNRAGYTKMDQIIQTVLSTGDPNANHKWDAGVVLEQPSCLVDGMTEYTCTVCGCKKDVVLPASGSHTWAEPWVSIEPTCVSEGQYSYPCINCGAIMTEPIPPTGVHTWQNGAVLTQPTCTLSGLQRCTCKYCPAETEKTLAPLGHAWAVTAQTGYTEQDLHGGTVDYACSRCGETKQARLCASEVFVDMPKEGKWSHAPIDWAWVRGITSGTDETHFSPKELCTRGQVVTFLWNAAGKPEPAGSSNPFVDVAEGKFYYKAVLWAVETGITSGTDETHFSPKDNCTRAQVVTFLWNAAGKPEPWNTEEGAALPACPFTDVKSGAFYYKALLWAYTTGIASGVDATQFAPKAICTRDQVATFLYYAAAEG